MREFYPIFCEDTIGETVFPQFKNLPTTTNGRRFYLSWSHYLKLMRISYVDVFMKSRQLKMIGVFQN